MPNFHILWRTWTQDTDVLFFPLNLDTVLGCVQTDATTTIVGATMLEVVACVLAAVCKRMQQLPTVLGPAVHRWKDTTHKSLSTMRNERAWPQQCWKSCANWSNIVALRFGDHGTKEMLGVVGWKVWPVSNFAQQHATTSNNMQQGMQTDATCNIQQCWELLHTNVASVSLCLRNQLHKILPIFEREGISAIKFETARIYFLSDVFVAIAVVVE